MQIDPFHELFSISFKAKKLTTGKYLSLWCTCTKQNPEHQTKDIKLFSALALELDRNQQLSGASSTQNTAYHTKAKIATTTMVHTSTLR